MLRRALAPVFMFTLALLLSGCATGRNQADLQMQGLKNQISILETQLQNKDSEVLALREALGRSTEERRLPLRELKKTKVIGEVKLRPKIKHIQIALRNAGFDPGTIDGRMGTQTREAIKAFQKANNLQADGRAGRQTWAALKEYLYKKTK